MPLIIDGHNLIPKIPGLSLSMMDDEVALIEKLIVYSRVARKQITLFFDNAPPGKAGEQRFGTVKVIFVRQGRSADAAIWAMVKRLGERAKNWSVISSDMDVQAYAKTVGAKVVSSEKFARILMSALNQEDQDLDFEDEHYPDDGEVKRWLEIFNSETSDDK